MNTTHLPDKEKDIPSVCNSIIFNEIGFGNLKLCHSARTYVSMLGEDEEENCGWGRRVATETTIEITLLIL